MTATFVDGSLRRYVPLGPTGTTLLALTNYISETISFDGLNFVPSAATVQYGPSYAPLLLTCNVNQLLSSATRIVCDTESSGTGHKIGAPMAFTVTVDGVAVTGTDTYRFPFVPDVQRVYGCSPWDRNSTVTTGCPTRGRCLGSVPPWRIIFSFFFNRLHRAC